MSQQTSQYDTRFYTIKKNYVEALRTNSDPEELHSRLHSLLLEAIKIGITLPELLQMLGESLPDGKENTFKENVSMKYAESQASEKQICDEKKTRDESTSKHTNTVLS